MRTAVTVTIILSQTRLLQSSTNVERFRWKSVPPSSGYYN